MTLERDHDRTQAAVTQTTTDSDLAPGRSNRSNQLASPERPLVSALILRKARDANGVAESADRSVATASTSMGHALPGTLMRKFESSLGADLSNVRVHTGSESHAAADAVGAKAYTIGNDIHFGAGHYDPNSSSGEHLLAHEVAHTVQQSGSASRKPMFKLEVSSPQDHAELEADRAAAAMVSGSSFAVSGAPIIAARRGDKKDDNKEEEHKGDLKLPTLLDAGLKIPIGGGKLGNLTVGKSGGTYESPKAGAEAKLFELKQNKPIPVAPGVMIDAGVDASGGLEANISGSVSVQEEDSPGPRVEPGKQLVMTAKGGGKLEAKVEGGVTLGIGAGAPIAYLSGNVHAGLTAKGGIGATLTGQAIVNPENEVSGAIKFAVTGEATLEADATLNVDFVLLGDRNHLYTTELGRRKLGEVIVECVTVYDEGGVHGEEPTVKAEWYGFPAPEPRQKRALTPEEKKKYFVPNPVDEGASGGRADTTPTEVEMTNPELEAEAKKSLLAKLAALQGKEMAISDHGTVDVDGIEAPAVAAVTDDQKRSMAEHGKAIDIVTNGIVTGWNYRGDASIFEGDKTVAAVEARMVHLTEIQLVGIKFTTHDIPMERCKV